MMELQQIEAGQRCNASELERIKKLTDDAGAKIQSEL